MDDSQLFLVHVWPPKPGFRVSARRVDSDEPQLLNSPQELADYFARASGVAPAAQAAVPPGQRVPQALGSAADESDPHSHIGAADLATPLTSVPPAATEASPLQPLGGPDESPR